MWIHALRRRTFLSAGHREGHDAFESPQSAGRLWDDGAILPENI